MFISEELDFPVVLYDIFHVEIIGETRHQYEGHGRHAKMFMPCENGEYYGISTPKLDDKINESNASPADVMNMVKEDIDNLLLGALRYGLVVFDMPNPNATIIAYRIDAGKSNPKWEVLMPTDGAVDTIHKLKLIMPKLATEKDAKALCL